MNIFVFSESSLLIAELLAGANEIIQKEGGTTSAIILGTEADAQSAISMGADKVYLIDARGDCLIDDFVPTIAKLVSDQKPTALLVGATTRGKLVAGRVAAALDTAAIVNAKEIKNINGSLLVQHMIFGGAAIRIEKPQKNVLVATIGGGVFSQAPIDQSRTGRIEPVEFVEPLVKTIKIESKPKKTSSSNISSAKRVVGAGRGFASREELSAAKELADALDGEVGYTRPVTEGNPPIAEDQPYIGVSGIQIKPDLYLAVGISGQTQHIIGVIDSRVIVCINNEPKALMFRHSDYGIVGDFHEVVPELIQALREARK